MKITSDREHFKKLIKIASDITIGSITPIITWFCIGLIIDTKLVTVFTITYPLQFVTLLIINIFGTGANIEGTKHNRPELVNSSFLMGILATVIVFGTLAINAQSYMEFMKLSDESLVTFAVYSILSLGIVTIFCLSMEKLYFNDKETVGLKYRFIYNIISFSVIIGMSLITKNQVVIVTVALLSISIYMVIIIIKEKLYVVHKFDYNISNNIKYKLKSITGNIIKIGIFLFGIQNVNSFGLEYTIAMNFVALTTDTQWDAVSSITVVAEVDLSRGVFDYKKHMRNAYKLVSILMASSILMIIGLHGAYNVNLKLVLTYYCIEAISFIIWAYYDMDATILQLEISSKKATVVGILAHSIQLLICVGLNSPFCTAIALVTNSLVQLIGYGWFVRKHKQRYIKPQLLEGS